MRLRTVIGPVLASMLVVAATIVATVAPASAAAAVLRVPQDFPTIQAAINAAAAADTVLVAPGTYVELIDFLGKDITVESAAGPADTIIDGNQAGAVVRIRSTAGQLPVLRGFTIRNGNDTSLIGEGGGIALFSGPALIEGNRVTGNASCGSGGIGAQFSTATIRGNVISGNRPNCSSVLGGGGIDIGGDGSVQVLDNTITGNVAEAFGGGIAMNAAGTPTISGNVISDNQTLIGDGGGISMINHSDALITNNIIAGNRARRGGGIYWSVPSGSQGPTVVNNTIVNNGPVADNSEQAGTAVFAEGFDTATRLINNILAGSTSHALVDCDAVFDPNPPTISHNDVFNAGIGPAYGGGICPDQTGVNGNISADPQLIDPAAGNFHLRGASPAIDAGLNTLAPATDIDGDARPLDGNGDGVPVADMGADEFSTPPTIVCTATPATLSPANHKLRSVSVDISASDDSGSVTVTLVSVTSNQADSGLGGGDMPNDILDWTTGTDDRSGLLRAEQFGAARVYTLTYQAGDPAGNVATCQTAVTVPTKA